MPFQLEDTQRWTDHYVEQGFVHLKGVVGPEFTEPGLREIRKIIKNDLPLDQWTQENTPKRAPVPTSEMQVLPKVYDQPGIRTMIDTMFGSPDEWNGQRNFQVFINAYDESAQPSVKPQGHIDFVDCPVPTLGSGFMFQVSLVKSEPFSGNLSVFPGTHKLIQRALVEDPNRRFPKDLASLLKREPYEFVADPGDVLVFHHLVGHAGNPSHAPNRSPRVGLHCQGLRKWWLEEIDPQTPGLSPWARSLAVAGKHRPPQNEERIMTDYYEHKKARQLAGAM